MLNLLKKCDSCSSIVGCINCDQTSCLTCIDGYELDNTKKCILCSTIYDNCVNCNAISCTQCQIGYIMD